MDKFRQRFRYGLIFPMLIAAFIGLVSGIMTVGEAILNRSIPEEFWATSLFSMGALGISGLIWLVRRSMRGCPSS